MFRDVSRYAPPTPEEEKVLVRRVADGDPEAEAELVARNLRLVLDVSKRYQTPGASSEDLIQEGAIGLIRAARRFDPSRGFRFSTFAHWWIRQGISRFVKGPTRVVRLPEYLQDRIARALKARRELSWGRAKDASEEEVGARLGMSPRKIRKLIEYSKDAVSLDNTVGGSEALEVGNTVTDGGRAPEDEVAYRGAQQAMVKGLGKLPERQTQILAFRFGLADGNPRSRPWIGKRMGISAERVRQIERQALKSLRQEMELQGQVA
jgi:RNA polymerase sigma factor (sigma-70 family)